MNLSLMAASEPVQVDTSPPLEMEVIREISFLKRHKAAEPEGLPPSLLKEGREVLTSELKTPGDQSGQAK